MNLGELEAGGACRVVLRGQTRDGSRAATRNPAVQRRAKSGSLMSVSAGARSSTHLREREGGPAWLWAWVDQPHQGTSAWE
jgi:hypothetical protein